VAQQRESEHTMVAAARTPFGALLKRYRVAAGLSQEALAERARLSTRGISDLERGRHRLPYRDTVARLAEALGLDGAERAALEAMGRGLRDAALAAGAFEHAAVLMERIARTLYGQGALRTLHAWLDALPRSVVRARPGLCLVQSWLWLDRRRLDQAGQALQDAEVALHSSSARRQSGRGCRGAASRRSSSRPWPTRPSAT
jgi:transcriptional regulator with XRE-family HTH domain